MFGFGRLPTNEQVEATAKVLLDLLTPELARIRAEVKALREAHNELADEMMREHGIAAETEPYGFPCAMRERPRRFAYDETRVIRRTKPSKAK